MAVMLLEELPENEESDEIASCWRTERRTRAKTWGGPPPPPPTRGNRPPPSRHGQQKFVISEDCKDCAPGVAPI